MRSRHPDNANFDFQIGQLVRIKHYHSQYNGKIAVINELKATVPIMSDNIARGIIRGSGGNVISFYLYRLTPVEDEQPDFEDNDEYGEGW